MGYSWCCCIVALPERRLSISPAIILGWDERAQPQVASLVSLAVFRFEAPPGSRKAVLSQTKSRFPQLNK
jgi:hypothetical protein